MDKEHKRNVSKIMGIVQAIFIYAGIFLISILIALIKIDFNVKELKTADFWIILAITTVIMYLTYYSSFTFTFSLKMTDKRYVEINESIDQSTPFCLGNKFDAYIEKLDWQQKVKAWKTFYTVKINNLKSRTSPKVYLQLDKFKLDPNFKIGVSAKRYLKKMERWTTRLSDEWISKNLKFVRKFTYPKVTVSDVLIGASSYESNSRLIDNKYVTRILTKKILFVLLAAVGSTLMAMLIIDPKDEFELLELLTFFSSLFLSIIMNTVMGSLSGLRAHKERLAADTQRLSIITDYLEVENIDITKPIIEKVPEADEIKITELEVPNDITTIGADIGPII